MSGLGSAPPSPPSPPTDHNRQNLQDLHVEDFSTPPTLPPRRPSVVLGEVCALTKDMLQEAEANTPSKKSKQQGKEQVARTTMTTAMRQEQGQRQEQEQKRGGELQIQQGLPNMVLPQRELNGVLSRQVRGGARPLKIYAHAPHV